MNLSCRFQDCPLDDFDACGQGSLGPVASSEGWKTRCRPVFDALGCQAKDFEPYLPGNADV